MADFSEDAAADIEFAIDLELDYLLDHFHGRVFTGLAGALFEHDADIFQDRQDAYRSLDTAVQEFALLATYIGGTCRPGATGKRLAAAQSLERALGYTTGRIWPDISVGPETTRINPDHLFDIMVDWDGYVIIPQDDEGDSSSSSDAHEGL